MKLELLRILLCACVLACHAYPGSLPMVGHVGVVGFFVLAGYMLQVSLYKMGGRLYLERYYRSRAKRLLPAYILSSLLAVVPACLLWLEGVKLSHFSPQPGGAFYLFYWIVPYNYAAWFMGCFFTYVLLVPFFWTLHRTRWGIELLCLFAMLGAGILYASCKGGSEVMVALMVAPEARMWEFLAGMVVARTVRGKTLSIPRWLRYLGTLGIFVLLSALTLWGILYCDLGFSLSNPYWSVVAYVAMFAIIIPLWADGKAFSSPLVTRAVQWGASMTYGVYLFHLPVWHLVKFVCGRCIPGSVPIILQLAIGCVLLLVIVESLNRLCAWYWRKPA